MNILEITYGNLIIEKERLENRVEKLEQQLKEARRHLTESVVKECKCKANISVNNDLVNRNLELKKLLERIAGACGNTNASDDCRDILKLYKEYLDKYKARG